MPLNYKIEGGILYETVKGEIRLQKQIDLVQEALADPALPSPLKVLRDARKQIGLIGDSLEELQHIIDLLNRLAPGTQMAIVASENVAFGMSRVFQARVHQTHDVSVFRDIDEAREWLLQPSEPEETSR